jgi:hypothetical protein
VTVPIFASREILDIYTACKDSGEVVDAQNKWIENLQKQHQASDDSESFLVDISLLKIDVLKLHAMKLNLPAHLVYLSPVAIACHKRYSGGVVELYWECNSAGLWEIK